MYYIYKKGSTIKNSINVKITKTENVKVELSDIKNLTLELLKEMYNFKENYYIKEDLVMEDVEYYTRGIIKSEVIRKATEMDKFLYTIIRDIRKFEVN